MWLEVGSGLELGFKLWLWTGLLEKVLKYKQFLKRDRYISK